MQKQILIGNARRKSNFNKYKNQGTIFPRIVSAAKIQNGNYSGKYGR